MAEGSYPWFIEKLKNENCREFVAKLQTFSLRFPTDVTREEASEIFFSFLAKAEEKIHGLEVFASLALEPQIGDCLEKFLLKLLDGKLSQPEDTVLDKVLFEKMGQMTDRVDLARHLNGPELATIDRSIIDLAIKELAGLESYRAPKDKLQCFLNAQKLVKYALELGGNVWGAEQLLPLTIYTVVQARPKKLVSDVRLIRHFSRPQRLRGEIDYFFTQLEMTVEFIASFDLRILKKLSIEQEQHLHALQTTFLDRHDMSMAELPLLIEEAKTIDSFLSNAGFDSDLDLNKMKIDQMPELLTWYAKHAEFIRKLKSSKYSC